MKAAVMFPAESFPRYMEFPEPVAEGDDQVLVSVKAVAIKHFDRGRAAGRHYSSETPRTGGRVVGGDGICVLEDGNRVYAMGVSGMLAEKAVVHRGRMVRVPAGLSDAVAAALPNAVIGAAMGLRFKADVRPGDVVLINGATGFTGRLAVQIARHYGAGRIIATGRNAASLRELLALGADEVVPVGSRASGGSVEVGVLEASGASASSGGLGERIAAIHRITPIDVVIDYLWGETAEAILGCLKGNGDFTNKIRYVSVGAMTGDIIRLSAENMRSVNLQLAGSGLGAWTREQVGEFFSGILPEMFEMAASGKLSVKTTTVPLAEIGELWDREVGNGERLVVTL